MNTSAKENTESKNIPLFQGASKKTTGMVELLGVMGIDDDEHRKYLCEECEELDLMNAWAPIFDSHANGRKSVNPDDLLVDYLLGISNYDPIPPRTIMYDPNGIEEPLYPASAIIFEDGSRAIAHQRSRILVEVDTGFEWRTSEESSLHIVTPGINSLPVEALRPGMRVVDANAVKPRTIFNIIAVKNAKFREISNDDPVSDPQGITLVPIHGFHHWVETNEFPDIDVDFHPDILDQIIPWAKKRFGEENVVGVATYQRFGMKSSFKDVCRVYDIPLSEVNQLREAIPDEVQKLKVTDKDFEERWDQIIQESPEIQEWLTASGELGESHRAIFEMMKRMQGRIRTFSQHASAMIISSVPVTGRIPLIMRENEKRDPVTGVKTKVRNTLSSWTEGQNATELSRFGFIKFDRLGLITLRDIEACLDILYERKKLNRESGIYRQPIPDGIGEDDNWMFGDWTDEDYLEDKDMLKAAAEGRTIGCFQFESAGIRRLLQDIHIDNFEELSAANAMYRPGVLKAKIDGVDGGDQAFIKRKFGEIKYAIPEILKPHLGKTHGLLVFQEQVMQILNIVGGIPMTDCEAARKAISKKKTEVLNKYRHTFAKNAKKTVGWSYDEAAKFFDDNIVTWSGYGFNKCVSPDSVVIYENGMACKAINCKPGDRIKSFDPEKNEEFFDEVVDVHHNGRKTTFEVELETGETLRCTMDHELVCEDGVKRKLKDIIKRGDRVMAEDKKTPIKDEF